MANNQQLLMGEGAGSAPAVFVEDVFSAYVYAGSNSSLTITNNIDLSTKGGLIWIKARTTTYGHKLTDTVRGGGKALSSNNSGSAGNSVPPEVSSFNTTGFTLEGATVQNNGGYDFVSWTFREQPKFFDIVTYTGTGSNTTFAHSLGSVPGCIIVKRTDIGADWAVYHRSLANTQYLVLNTTAAAATGATWWNSTTPTSAVFSVGTDASVNASGGTYVAYLYAHDAGGFGLAGTDNVISCGSWSTTLIGGRYDALIDIGFEPQFLIFKPTNNTGNWQMYDSMRGLTANAVGSNDSKRLYPSLQNAEDTDTATQVQYTGSGKILYGVGASGYSGIYIAIRRGPMKVPTVGTSVFDPEAYTGTSATRTVTSGFPVDLSISNIRSQAYPGGWFDRLRGALQVIRSSTTDPEVTSPDSLTGFDSMTGVVLGSDPGGRINRSPETYAMWNFQRAPGFFDAVCDTGTGAAHTITHNLGVPAELFIRKMRSGLSNWWCYNSIVGGTKSIKLNDSGTYNTSVVYWNDTDPTSTTFSVGTTAEVNQSGSTFVTYLFATCAGVSKVGSYTGNGSSQTIACGFAAGSRFVMIKRTDSTGDWYVWDSARGIIAGNDPHLSLNTTVAEVTTDDSVDTDNSGFIVNQLSATNVNVTSATYIFLAIA